MFKFQEQDNFPPGYIARHEEILPIVQKRLPERFSAKFADRHWGIHGGCHLFEVILRREEDLDICCNAAIDDSTFKSAPETALNEFLIAIIEWEQKIICEAEEEGDRGKKIR
ncbi:MAG: hypothetical protein ACRCYP_01665 [Alphaproteobacteria bacterium]